MSRTRSPLEQCQLSESKPGTTVKYFDSSSTDSSCGAKTCSRTDRQQSRHQHARNNTTIHMSSKRPSRDSPKAQAL
eukprot:4127712-Amphidinium_carterae.1